MSDTKWADVAHYYTKSQIDLQIKNRDHAERFLMVSFRNVGGSHFEEWVNDGVYWRAYGSQFSAWADHKPILRHRDDMTEAEARELWEIQIGEAWVQDTDETAIQCLFFNIGNSQMEMADNATFLSVLVGEPKAWNYLISRGFDLFGLIESGQAIRKEMGNGNS